MLVTFEISCVDCLLDAILPKLDETIIIIISISSQDLDNRSGLPLAPNRKIGKPDPVPLLALQALEVPAILFLSWGAGSEFFAVAVQWQVSLVLVLVIGPFVSAIVSQRCTVALTQYL